MQQMQQNLMLQIGSIILLPSTQGPQRKFKVIKQLGQGGYGVVYQVQPLDLFQGSDVAIKIQNMATENEIKFIDLLIDYQNKENQLSQDQRSQIIRIYERTQYEGNLVTIMELGQSDLYSILLKNNGFQTLNDKIKALNQMAQSIWFLHHNKLTHRDLKPENYIKVGEELKLIDFGLVKFHEQKLNFCQQKMQTPNVGSILFQAPEIKQGSNNYTEAVDIWSLGGTFYEILTESQFNCDNLNISTIEIKVPQNSFVNQQILNLIKTLLNGMLQINSSSRLKINEVKQQLTYIQNLIQQPYIIPNNFPPPFVNPFPPKPQQLPNQPNQIANQFLNQFPPAQNFFPQQNFVFEKKQVEPVAAQSSDQNSQLTNLIMGMRDMFVERFDQQQKQISDIQHQNFQIEKNLKENLQEHMQDLNKKIELSIKQNIESQFGNIQNTEKETLNQLKETFQQQNQIIYKQEELLNVQTQQYQSLIKDIQQTVSNLAQQQDGYLKNLNQNLDKNWQKLTNDISEFKELVQNQQQFQKQLIEQKEINRQNFMQQLNEKFQDLNQLIISQLICKQEINDRMEQSQTNITVQFDQQNQCKDTNEYNLMQNQLQISNDLIKQDEIKQLNQQNFSQGEQEEDNNNIKKFGKKDKKQIDKIQQQKYIKQYGSKDVTQKQFVKNLSQTNIQQIQHKNQYNEISQNAQSEFIGKLQTNQMENQRLPRFDRGQNLNIQEQQQHEGQKMRPSSCPNYKIQCYQNNQKTKKKII